MKKNIIIYGMRGTGKSSIGRLLSQKLDKVFVDLDEYINKKIGEEIQTYIEKKGWDEFREREYECLREVLESNHDDSVISLGGGTIIFERNQNLILKNNYKLIYVYSDIEKIQKRIQKDQSEGSTRNSLTGKNVIDELTEIYEKRKDMYERFYDFKVTNNES
ncbi:MAG: shikimate kinase, partial [Candidatus Gracilibacteria bacterium]|nr:shikimate kinase [Candidatus Gracilibacteria bacterium]